MSYRAHTAKEPSLWEEDYGGTDEKPCEFCGGHPDHCSLDCFNLQSLAETPDAMKEDGYDPD